MNLILLSSSDFISEHHVQLSGRRFEHCQEILKVSSGKELTIGRLNGLVGLGKVTKISKDSLEMEVELNQKPPAPLNLTLIMALPRPQMFKRTLHCVASLGVKKIIILNFSKVDKSFWNSSNLKSEAIEHELMFGLEQAKDTVMPEVILEKRFKPFVEDKLPLLIKNSQALVAHPGTGHACPKLSKKRLTLVIGPEGGITEFEINQLTSIGFSTIDLGPRILRFESVVPYLIGKLF